MMGKYLAAQLSITGDSPQTACLIAAFVRRHITLGPIRDLRGTLTRVPCQKLPRAWLIEGTASRLGPG